MTRTWIIVGLVVVILLLLWIIGLLTDIMRAFIHILLVFVVIAVIAGFVAGRRTA